MANITVSENGHTYVVTSVSKNTATLEDGSKITLSENLKAEIEAQQPVVQRLINKVESAL